MLFRSLVAPVSGLTQPITETNWQNHAAIVQIRAIYQSIQKDEAAGRLRKIRKQWPGDCEKQPYEDDERILYVDAKGAVRSYHFSGGSEDSSMTRALYYDQEGKLRFALIKAGAVNGTSLEHRVYLGADGARLWERQTLLKGPGYTFPQREWPDADLVRRPKSAFDDNAPCQKRG